MTTWHLNPTRDTAVFKTLVRCPSVLQRRMMASLSSFSIFQRKNDPRYNPK